MRLSRDKRDRSAYRGRLESTVRPLRLPLSRINPGGPYSVILIDPRQSTLITLHSLSVKKGRPARKDWTRQERSSHTRFTITAVPVGSFSCHALCFLRQVTICSGLTSRFNAPDGTSSLSKMENDPARDRHNRSVFRVFPFTISRRSAPDCRLAQSARHI